MQNADWSIIGQQVGLGSLLGLSIGYTTKKALKVVLIVVALLLLILLLLQSIGFVDIHWAVVEQTYSDTFDHPQGMLGVLTDWATSLGNMLPVAGSFIVGFLIGFRIG